MAQRYIFLFLMCFARKVFFFLSLLQYYPPAVYTTLRTVRGHVRPQYHTYLSERWYMISAIFKNRPRKNNPMPMFPSTWAQFTSHCCFFGGGLPECQTHSRPIFASFATGRGQKRFYFIPFSPQPPKIFDRQFFLPPSLPAKEEM